MSEPAPPDIRDLEAGQTFDGFRLEAPLNAGGMASQRSRMFWPAGGPCGALIGAGRPTGPVA